jgi:uncharacterized hydrophobic protein (TIGR00341 family)
VRLVQVSIPTGKRDAVLSTLDEEGIDYVVADETSGREYTAVVTFPLPSQAVEPVLESLREVGIERDAYTVVLAAETVVSKQFEALVERYEADTDGDRIAREELRARAEEMAPTVTTYALMTVVSVVIATAGLLLDSPSVVVGSMVIAPLIGPAMATNVGTVLADEELFGRGLKLQVLGLMLAVVAATAFALFVKTTNLIPPGLEVTEVGEVAERTTPDVLSLVVALGAGVAGAVSLRSGVSASLVGVMIAVALVPPTAAIGIGIAWGVPTVVVGSSVLVLVNTLSINLAALATFWYGGYRPESWFALDQARSSLATQTGVLVAAILVLSVALGGVTYGSFQQATMEQSVRTGVSEAVGDDATVQSLHVEPEGGPLRTPLSAEPDRVVVTVGVAEGDRPADLAARIRAALAERGYGSATVEVRFVDVQTAGAVGVEAADRRAYSSKGNSGSYPTASTAASSTASRFSSSVTLM